MPLARCRAFTVVPLRFAMRSSVSPDFTVYLLGLDVFLVRFFVAFFFLLSSAFFIVRFVVAVWLLPIELSVADAECAFGLEDAEAVSEALAVGAYNLRCGTVGEGLSACA